MEQSFPKDETIVESTCVDVLFERKSKRFDELLRLHLREDLILFGTHIAIRRLPVDKKKSSTMSQDAFCLLEGRPLIRALKKNIRQNDDVARLVA